MSDENLISLDEIAATLDAYAGPPRPHRSSVSKRRRLRRIVWAAPVVALVFVGAAFAAGLDPFAGISAANHPQGSADVLDPALQDAITAINANFEQTINGTLQPDTSRLISGLADGGHVYAIATTTGQLCVLVQEHPGSSNDTGIACGYPLSQSQPTTEQTIQPDPSLPPLSVGVAQDGVVAVSFTVNGEQVTVPVSDNVWSYQGVPDATSSLTAHYSDGRTQTAALEARTRRERALRQAEAVARGARHEHPSVAKR